MGKAKHPAKFTGAILKEAVEIFKNCGINGNEKVFDPFGGTGKIFFLLNFYPNLDITAFEIEPEWAAWDERVTVGNALDNKFPDSYFDIIFTSPVYGNRISDHHNAKDGSERNTYTHKLGRPLHPDNSGKLQWGEKYRDFHREAWAETVRVLRPNGLFLLNIKDHIRRGKVQEVSAWHYEHLTKELDLRSIVSVKVPVKGSGYGSNRKVRVFYENLFLFEKSAYLLGE